MLPGRPLRAPVRPSAVPQPLEVPVPVPRPFAEVWPAAEPIDGWLTRDQAQVLHEQAARVAPGLVVEIGNHLGRSTVVLGASGAEVAAIDPFPSGWKYGGEDTAARFAANLRAAGVHDAVTQHPRPSTDVLAGWETPIRMLYVDGKHDARSCLQDLGWTRHLGRGDRFLVHDAFSSVGVTLALLWWLVTDRRSRYLGRTGSLALYEMTPSTLSDRARVLGELPWFARNLLVKVLLRLRQRRLARLLGHTIAADPY